MLARDCRRTWQKVVFAVAAALLPFGALAQPFDALYAFGDSLTDTGREPAEPLLHYDGRWSNGPLWVEYLSSRLGLIYSASNNHAHSGAQADDTYGQIVNDFFPTNSISNSLCVVWAGGNDFIQTWDDNLFDDSKWDAMITHGVTNLSNAVVTLYVKGARTILVPNTVDVSRIPIVQNTTFRFARDYLRSKVLQWNATLASALDGLETNHPSLNLRRADAYAFMYAVVFTNSAYGFTVTDVGAIDDLTLFDKSFNGPGRNYVFWDVIHPTTKVHAMIADRFLAAVAPLVPRAEITGAGALQTLSVTNLHVGQTYTFQQSADLASWTNMAAVVNYTSALQTVMVTNTLPAAFYRAWFQP